ncbi:MAG: elongation factor G [Erysipelotrichaceae bacterium]|jgi:elongation factor G|nr:elongation factor G [Erysipelotrichaceae bacterium]MBQ1378729.1 elongation factor G [Erysipelotrichaceae bacterium]MBQ1909974.1 elongation factor G [Erysipelotrichaceae bacterium]MBQ2079134.1 elongation factor G [Erysipelotrichaceae bacterium]MBQ2505184.1 elongation factor G [Erysipelotrichaceae bacterium]
MKEYLAKDIRNVVLLGHSGAGKTALVESALFQTKAIDRMGKTTDGTAAMDYDPEEAKRGVSIYTAIAPVEWKNVKINFIDTPGYLDYEGEKVTGAAAADLAVIVVSAKDGIESGTESAVKLCKKNSIPVVFFINKIDDDNANFEKTVDELRAKFGDSVVPFEVPVMEGKKMTGSNKVLDDPSNPHFDQISEAIASADDELMEKFFEGEPFTPEETAKGLKLALNSGDVKPVFAGTATGCAGVTSLMDFIKENCPVYIDYGTVTDKNGTVLKTDDSEAFSALVFKTVVDAFVGKISYVKVLSGTLTATTPLYNSKKDQAEKAGGLFTVCGKQQNPINKLSCGDIGALTKLLVTETNDTLCTKEKKVVYRDIEYPRPMLGVAVSPKTKDDEDKMSDALKKVLIEDKSLNFVRNAETGEQVLYGVGDQQLDVVVNKLKTRYKVEIVLKEPKVQYRETIRGKSEVQGKYKKQNGGAGQYGDVWIRFEPNPDSEEMVFAEEVFGGAVPKNYFPSVEAGLRSCMAKGPLAGCKVVNVKATLYDGSYHPVDSKPNSFEAAARLAFKAGIPKANPILLEPIGKVTVICPEEYTGDIIGDFNKRRGMILDTGSADSGEARIEAEVPMAEMLKYATELRSMTKGRGTYVIDFDRYEAAPQNVTDKVVAATAAERKDDDED